MDLEIIQSGSGKAVLHSQGTNPSHCKREIIEDDCDSQHSSRSRSHSSSKSVNTLSHDTRATSEEAPKPKRKVPPPPNISGGSRKVSENREVKKKEKLPYYIDSAQGADRRGGFAPRQRRRGGGRKRWQTRGSYFYRYSNSPYGRQNSNYQGPSSVGNDWQNSPRGDDETEEEFISQFGMWNEVNEKFQRSARKFYFEKRHEAKEVIELRERNSILEEEIVKLQETVEKKCETENSLEGVNVQLTIMVREKEAQIRELENELENSKATNNKVVREWDELRLANSSLKDDLSKAKKEILFMEQEKESAKKEIESRAGALTNLVAELETFKAEMESKIGEMNEEKLNLEANLKKKTHECEYRKINNNRLKQQVHKELHKLKNKLKNEIDLKISEIEKIVLPPQTNHNRGKESLEKIGPPPPSKPSSSGTDGKVDKDNIPTPSTSGFMNSSEPIIQGQGSKETNQIRNVGGPKLPSAEGQSKKRKTVEKEDATPSNKTQLVSEGM